MRKIVQVLIMLSLVAYFSCSNPNNKFSYPDIKAPVAAVKPFEITSKDGHVRTDNYYWLKDRENQEVLDYLKAENDYLDSMMSHTQPFQQ